MNRTKDPYIAKALLVQIGDRVLPVFCYDLDWYKEVYYGLQIRTRNLNRDNIDSNWIVYIGSNGLKSDSIAMPNKCHSFSENAIIRTLGIIGYMKVDEARRKVSIISQIDVLKAQRNKVTQIIAQKKSVNKIKGLNKELKRLNKIIEPCTNHSSSRDRIKYSCKNPKPYRGGGFSPK
jgi:hypothetical protein